MADLTTHLTLEARVRRLEDLEEIRMVTARYAHAVNKGWDGKTIDLEALRNVFADDVEWEMKDFGARGVGLETILADIPQSTAMVEFSMHAPISPVIDLDGDSATSTWLFWIASRIAGDPRAVYMSADFEYSRKPEGWRIQKGSVVAGMLLSANPGFMNGPK